MANGSPDYPQNVEHFDIVDSPFGGVSGTLIDSANNQFYRITVAAMINNVNGQAVNLDCKVAWTENGKFGEAIVCSAASSAAGNVGLGGAMGIFPDQGTSVSFFANPTGTSAGDSIDFHIVAEGVY